MNCSSTSTCSPVPVSVYRQNILGTAILMLVTGTIIGLFAQNKLNIIP